MADCGLKTIKIKVVEDFRVCSKGWKDKVCFFLASSNMVILGIRIKQATAIHCLWKLGIVPDETHSKIFYGSYDVRMHSYGSFEYQNNMGCLCKPMFVTHGCFVNAVLWKTTFLYHCSIFKVFINKVYVLLYKH